MYPSRWQRTSNCGIFVLFALHWCISFHNLRCFKWCHIVGIGESLFTFFCLINICSSLSDEANKIKPLNIEREWQFQLSLKIWSRFSERFPRNSLLKTRNFTMRMYESVTFLPPSNFAVFDGWYFLQYCMQRAEKLHKLLELISSFNFWI